MQGEGVNNGKCFHPAETSIDSEKCDSVKRF